jgi:endonuclease YncB( thermonuclease family)
MKHLSLSSYILASTIVFVLPSCSQNYHYDRSTGDGQPTSTTEIYWSDGDSGRLNGTKFRLANIDAPETGGVGARGGAKCESERALGYEAKAFMVDLTRDAEVSITKRYGPDRYEREVIDLSVNGEQLAEVALDAGHIRPWPHKGRRALKPKPDWCNLG